MTFPFLYKERKNPLTVHSKQKESVTSSLLTQKDKKIMDSSYSNGNDHHHASSNGFSVSMENSGKILTCKGKSHAIFIFIFEKIQFHGDLCFFEIAAAVAYGPGEPLVVEEILVHPPKSMEVRIKILFTSICHTDLSAWKGEV